MRSTFTVTLLFTSKEMSDPEEVAALIREQWDESVAFAEGDTIGNIIVQKIPS